MADLVTRVPWLTANSMPDAAAPYGKRMNLRGGYLPADVPLNPGATAFSREGAAWLWEAVGMGDAPEHDARYEQWATTVDEALRPLSLASGCTNLTDDLGEAWRGGVHGSEAKHRRLRAVKDAWARPTCSASTRTSPHDCWTTRRVTLAIRRGDVGEELSMATFDTVRCGRGLRRRPARIPADAHRRRDRRRGGDVPMRQPEEGGGLLAVRARRIYESVAMCQESSADNSPYR